MTDTGEEADFLDCMTLRARQDFLGPESRLTPYILKQASNLAPFDAVRQPSRSALMGWKLVAAICILLCLSSPAQSLLRKKPRAANKTPKVTRGSRSKRYGERMPWEGRQETYDWEFREVIKPL